MNKFKQHKEEFDVPKLKKNKHFKAKAFTLFTLVLLIVLFFGLFFLLAKEFKNTHTFKWQSPIVLRTPVIIKRDMTIISPMSTQSGSMGIAYAEEVKNPFDARSPKGIAWEKVKEKWGYQEWGAFDALIQQESGWHNWSVNSESGACGLGQALPCSKMNVELWDYEGQLNWIMQYISNRYGTASKAWEHEQAEGWY